MYQKDIDMIGPDRSEDHIQPWDEVEFCRVASSGKTVVRTFYGFLISGKHLPRFGEVLIPHHVGVEVVVDEELCILRKKNIRTEIRQQKGKASPEIRPDVQRTG